MRDLRRRLIVPAFVTVTSFAPACSDDTPPSTSTDSTGSTTEVSASTSEVPTSTGDTDTGDTTDGTIPDCSMFADEPACEGAAGCLWDDLGGVCVTDCARIDDRTQCDMAAYCEWFDGACYPPI